MLFYTTGWTTEVRFLSVSSVSRPALWHTQPPMSSSVHFLGMKAAGALKMTTPLSVNVKNAWRYTSTPPYVCIAWCLVKHLLD
jgi:hypothetical protein